MAVEFEKAIHKVTEEFPKEEKYRKVDQLKRSSSSVCDNIAESYGKYSFGAKINCMYIARGESEEARRRVERCKETYIKPAIADSLIEKSTELIKGINGYIRYLKLQQQNKSLIK